MHESNYSKWGGEAYPSEAGGNLFGTSSHSGLGEGVGSFGGMDWASAGIFPAATDQHLQQLQPDAADNTAVGNINIPA